MTLLFHGSMVALITPFRAGKIDEPALRVLVDWHLQKGTHGLVPCGTTGEGSTLTDEEHERVIAIVVEQTDRKIPVLAGAGANATEKAIKLAKQAKRGGAQGTLQVTPYYNKPTQEGLYRHFAAIAKAVDLPIVLYNVPSRTAVNLEVDTVLRLAKIDTIVGIKEASGKLEPVDCLVKELGEKFGVYSGEDALNAQIYALGGAGAISVTANVVPDRVAKVWNLLSKGDKTNAMAEQENLQSLNRAMFLQTNPLPVKTALSLMGKCAEEFRLPLCPMDLSPKNKLIEVLKQEKLLS